MSCNWCRNCKLNSLLLLLFYLVNFPVSMCCCNVKWRQRKWCWEILSLSRLMLECRKMICYSGRLELKRVSLLKLIRGQIELMRNSVTDSTWMRRLDLWPLETLQIETLDSINCKSSTMNRPQSRDSMWLSTVSRTSFILITVFIYAAFPVLKSDWLSSFLRVLIKNVVFFSAVSWLLQQNKPLQVQFVFSKHL